MKPFRSTATVRTASTFAKNSVRKDETVNKQFERRTQSTAKPLPGPKARKGVSFQSSQNCTEDTKNRETSEL